MPDKTNFYFMIFRIILTFTIIFLIEFLAYRALRKFFTSATQRKKLKRIYLSVLGLLIGFVVIYYVVLQLWPLPDPVQFRKFFNITAILLLNVAPKIILIVFSLIDDLWQLFWRLWLYIRKHKYSKALLAQKIIISSGLAAGIFMLITILYGMLWGKSNFKVEEVYVASSRLPESFDGFRIAHISDLHLGSYRNNKDLKKGIALLMKQNPDMIVITGDIVNNEATEFLWYKNELSQLQAPYGVYSIMGNHDMGDYRRWYNEREKKCNLKKLITLKEEVGFKVLLNSHTFITKNTDSIAIAGVKNWGLPPFSSYGDLEKATKGKSTALFTILLSHDPSHWEEEVLGHTEIDLTLSGHTHGFQFGINTPNLKLSPVQLKYKRWMGLYQENKQFLYINRGFGYIGFAGRVGIYPEITIINLMHI